MTNVTFPISAFGDEIAPALEDQLKTMNDMQVDHLDLRTAWGTNVLHLTDEEVARVKQVCQDYGVTIACIGSPIGKSPLADPRENEENNLRRILQIASALGTPHIRIFSYYPPDTSTNAHYDQHVEESAARLSTLADMAAAENCILLMENEKDVVGDTPERCHALLSTVNSPALRFIWDPANFVQVGAERQVERYWDSLSPYIGYIHIKDAMLSDGSVKAAGEGDGQVKELLVKLRDSGYQGILSLEPHLAMAGHSTGFTGVTGMHYAVSALRGLIESL